MCALCRRETVAISIAGIRDDQRATGRVMGERSCAPAPPPIQNPAAKLVERPDEEDLMAERQSEQSHRGKDEDHAGEVEERFEKDRERCADISATAYRGAGGEAGSE